MHLDFHASPRPTLGVEWEFALVDKGTRDLTNSASELFDAVLPKLAEPDKLHKELLRNTVEVVTGVCDTVAEAMADLRGTLDVVSARRGQHRRGPVRGRHRTPSPPGRASTSPRAIATPS